MQVFKTLKITVGLMVFVLIHLQSIAQQKNQSSTKELNIDYHSDDATLDPSIKKGIEHIILTVYPKLSHDFNPDARKDIAIRIDTSYDGVAYANNGQVTISSAWLHKKPEDLDLVTHEIMHIVQAYLNGSGPGWLTEGIADYARYKYGLDNKGAGWSLTQFSSSQSYENSYRITARFLVWISEKYDAELVKKLDAHLRENTFNSNLWTDYTGKNVDELWKEYSENPKIS